MNRASLLAAMLLAIAPGAFADPFWQDDLDWLKIMAFAAHQTDYVGTFVYQYGNHVETSRITHIADRDGEHGRLEGLDGGLREIIHSNDQVRSYAGGRQVKVGYRQGLRAFPALLPEQLSLLNENYRINKAEEVRVAGFHTRAFVFQPRDHLRYTHKMWAHSDSGLLLKAAVLDERGRVIEQYAFTQLTIGGNIDRQWIALDNSAPRFCAREQHASFSPKPGEPVSVSGWQVGSLPPGFKKTMEMRRLLHGREAPVTHLVFSDGLAGISIFIEEMSRRPDVNVGLTSQGAIQVYSKMNGDHLVTAVGEVPPATLMRVADSIRYQKQ